MASLERHYISTGHFPAPEMVQSLVQDTRRRSKSNSDSKNSQAYLALARVPSELFGVSVVGTSGRICAGDVDYEFYITSVSKPFLFALVCETTGFRRSASETRRGRQRTPFSSLTKIAANPSLPKEIQAQVDLGNITCVTSSRPTFRERSQVMSQGQRPEIDLISLARHVPSKESRRRH